MRVSDQHGFGLGRLVRLKGLVGVGVSAGEGRYVEAGIASSAANLIGAHPAVCRVQFPYLVRCCGDGFGLGCKVRFVLMTEDEPDVDGHGASYVVPDGAIDSTGCCFTAERPEGHGCLTLSGLLGSAT